LANKRYRKNGQHKPTNKALDNGQNISKEFYHWLMVAHNEG